jgi:hypothetical protein
MDNSPLSFTVSCNASGRYGRGCGVGRGLGVGVTLGVGVVVGVGVGVVVTVAVGVAVGVEVGVTVGVAVGVTVGVGVGVDVGVGVTVDVGLGVGVGPSCAQYLPPVLKSVELSAPPQIIISLPIQTDLETYRGEGALVVLVAIQLSVLGLYLPPVLK